MFNISPWSEALLTTVSSILMFIPINMLPEDGPGLKIWILFKIILEEFVAVLGSGV